MACGACCSALTHRGRDIRICLLSRRMRLDVRPCSIADVGKDRFRVNVSPCQKDFGASLARNARSRRLSASLATLLRAVAKCWHGGGHGSPGGLTGSGSGTQTA